MDTKKLIEARARAWDAATALLDSAEAEGRSTDAEVEAAWQKAMADVDTIDARIKQFSDAEARSALIESSRRELGVSTGVEHAEGNASQKLETQLRSFLKGESRELVIPQERRDLNPSRESNAARRGLFGR